MILTLGLALTPALLAAPAATVPLQLPPSAVTVSVTAAASGADVVYETVVRNTDAASVTATVRQQLPEGVTHATAGEAGAVRGDSIQWTASLPGGGMVTLRSTATVPATRTESFSSVCVADQSGSALDCASAAAAPAVAPTEPPLWRRLLPWAAGLLALGVLTGIWRWRHRKPAHRPKAARTPRRARDMTWAAAGLTTVALAGALVAILLVAGPAMRSAVTRATGTDGGGWSGTPTALTLGAPASDDAVEFTVFLAECSSENAACTVVAAVRNTSDRPQVFYRSMQRLYISPEQWLTPDDSDAFAEPLAPGARQLLTIRFPLPEGQDAVRIELREGAFARGVYYEM